MYLIIKINMDNDAFADGENGTEVARILRHVCAEVIDTELDDDFYLSLRDINGNNVGKMEVKKWSGKL